MSVRVEEEVEGLAKLDLDGLRHFWRARFGAPSSLRSEPILRQLIAWRLQANAYGGLDEETRRLLARSGPVQAEGQHLGPGARLTRIWKGREVTVIVEKNGFRWDDQVFPSLSAAATAIAGTRWNGPRFFGLRGS
ncbi:MAG: DUF2924 domain-containing protein [Pseudomonadota bacterium]